MLPINLIPPNRFQRAVKQLHGFLDKIAEVTGLFLFMAAALLMAVPVLVLTSAIGLFRPCPNCKRRDSLMSFHPPELPRTTLYLCKRCQARFKRQNKIWEDASASKYDQFFRWIK